MVIYLRKDLPGIQCPLYGVPLPSLRSHELMFHWNGVSKRNFVLPPGIPRSMVVNAWFTTPGVYNLSCLRVKASYSSTSKEPHFQRFHQPSYITIMPSDTPVLP